MGTEGEGEEKRGAQCIKGNPNPNPTHGNQHVLGLGEET